MSKKSIVKNLNRNKPTANAEKLIKQAENILTPDFIQVLSPVILPSVAIELEELAENMEDARIVVHADGYGATVISSSGSVTMIGNDHVHFNKIDYNNFGRHVTNQSNAEYNYAINQIGKTLKNAGITRIEVAELDRALPDVAIMCTDNLDRITVADALGNIKVFNIVPKSSCITR